MKYIRTKDGHIAECVEYYKEDGIFIIKINGKPYFSVFEENVLKQADTIEELCDEFVTVSPDYKPQTSKLPFDFLKEQMLHHMKIGWKLYAAIWTKGKYDEPILKPVAELNDKGVLELL